MFLTTTAAKEKANIKNAAIAIFLLMILCYALGAFLSTNLCLTQVRLAVYYYMAIQSIMNKKYILSLFIFFVLALSGYFLYVIFSDNKDSATTRLPSQPTSSSSKSNLKQLEVTMSANPTELKALPKESNTKLKDAEKITLKTTYKNNTSSNLDKFQIQILNGQTIKYLTGSTLTAKFNKEDTATNKRATYDVEAARPGESKTASVLIYAKEPGVLNFRALVTTKEGPSATSLPVSVIIR